MMTIRTRITELLGIQYPVIQAGMSWVSSSPALPAAVSNAGGLGVLAVGPLRIQDLRRVLDETRQSTAKPWAVNFPLYRKDSETAQEIVLDFQPDILIASQGGPKQYLDRFHDVGTTCLHVVSSVEHAVKAAETGVDGLVVVGGEAGGHPPQDLVTSMVLIRAIARELPEMPLIASGGFADGEGLAAALALGADAAQFGTRFIMAQEANVHEKYQQRVGTAGVADTATVGRGIGMIRCLSNDFTDRMLELEHSGASLEERRQVFTSTVLREAVMDGHVDDGKVEAGQSAGLVDDVLPAVTIVSSIIEQYQRAVEGLQSMSAPISR